MSRFLALMVALALVSTPKAATGQAGTPTPIAELPAVEFSVARTFVKQGKPTPGETFLLAASVTAFDPSASNSDIVASSEKIAGVFGNQIGYYVGVMLRGTLSPEEAHLGKFLPTSAPKIGDFTYAWTAESANHAFGSAIITFGDGYLLYALSGSALQGAPLADLLAVADRLLNASSGTLSSAPDGDYRTTGVWVRLPRLEHLPAGFIFDREWVVVENRGDGTAP